MQYVSTRGGAPVSGTYALLHGLAPDGGLYVPALFPSTQLHYRELATLTYPEIAQRVLRDFFPTFTDTQWKTMLSKAYTTENFETPEIAPLHTLTDTVSILELFQGRTQAFKDMALSLFPYLLVAAKEAEGETKDILILTATSGDTGKAALEGFKDVSGTYIQVFYPTDGVSPMQKDQMSKQTGKNVCVTAIRGNFDDAQQFLKRLFVDTDMAESIAENNLIFSSANSINIGRLTPQIAYYVKAYVDLVNTGKLQEGEPFHVVVPTGNFGNILAAYFARKMGIPIGRLICASNTNKVLTDFFQTGTLNQNRDFHVTLSPSMDIIESSNFERFLYYIFNEDPDKTRDFMMAIKATGQASVSDKDKALIDTLFYGAYVNDEETTRIIGTIYKEEGYLLDPHTAVAIGAYKQFLSDFPNEELTPTVIAATAHPYKFPTAVCEAIGLSPKETPYKTLDALAKATQIAIPQQLAALRDMPVRFDKIINKEDLRDSVSTFANSIRQ